MHVNINCWIYSRQVAVQYTLNAVTLIVALPVFMYPFFLAIFLFRGQGLEAERYSLRDSGRSALKETDSFLSEDKIVRFKIDMWVEIMWCGVVCCVVVWYVWCVVLWCGMVLTK